MLLTHSPPTVLESMSLQAAGPVVLALQECTPELRAEAIGIFQDLASGELDEHQKLAATTLLAEILFPNADADSLPGLDLDRAEALAPEVNPEARPVLEDMDRQEAAFAVAVRQHMDRLGLTQTELAEKIGIGQSAVSMMLQRQCRPQRKTVERFAAALGVAVQDLWPSPAE